MARLERNFFARDAVIVAKDLAGKVLVHQSPDGKTVRMRISETEAYCGEEDTACHAHKGRTKRTEVMYGPAGTVYIYLCYGMHWLLNIVTGEVDDPQAVLIRACTEANGPAKLTKAMGITGELNHSSVLGPDAYLWVEDDGTHYDIQAKKRVGIGYAAQEDQDKLWRFCIEK